MFEDFPKNHNLILFGQSDLLAKISLKVNDGIKSRITYSTMLLTHLLAALIVPTLFLPYSGGAAAATLSYMPYCCSTTSN